MKKNKGFTLVELIAVIVILGIIGLIAIPTVTKVLKDAKEKLYASQVKMIKTNAKKWGIDNINQLSETKPVYLELSQLIDDGYIEQNELKNPRNTKETMNGCIVIEYNNESSKYEYKYFEDDCSDIKPFDCGSTDLVDSRDSNVYKTVLIGEQCWMAENLRYTENSCTEKYWKSSYEEDLNYGEPPYDACKSHSTDWGEEILYQWGAAMNGSTEGVQGLCPDGWYIPTDAEWTTLIDFVGTTPGTKLKAITPTWDGTDTVGFNAKPAGGRGTDGSLDFVGSYGNWWTSSISGSSAWGRGLSSGISGVYRDDGSQAYGLSVRCLLGQ